MNRLFTCLLPLIAVVLAPLSSAAAQKLAFTAEGERVYLYGNGTWSADPNRTLSELLEIELQQQRQSDSAEDRCTLIFGLQNGFEVDLREVEADLQFLDSDGQYVQTRRVSFKNPRSGKVRFAEVQLRLTGGCEGYASFDVVDAPNCQMDDGTKIENCFSSVTITEG